MIIIINLSSLPGTILTNQLPKNQKYNPFSSHFPYTKKSAATVLPPPNAKGTVSGAFSSSMTGYYSPYDTMSIPFAPVLKKNLRRTAPKPATAPPLPIPKLHYPRCCQTSSSRLTSSPSRCSFVYNAKTSVSDSARYLTIKSKIRRFPRTNAAAFGSKRFCAS